MLVSALALAAALAVSGTIFVTRARTLVGLVRAAAPAQPAQRIGDTPRRVRNEAEIVLGQSKLLQRLGPGLMHAFIFWGFLVLVPTILIALIGLVDKHSTLPWLGHQGWYALLVDVFCVLVLAGVLAAFYIRKVQRPNRFKGSHLGEANLILGLIATIVISLLLWHATRIALHEMGKQQIDILHGQDRVLAILDNFASQEMPERQRQIQDAVNTILAAVVKPALRSPTESLAPLIVAIKQLPAMLDKRGDDDERAGSG